MELTHVRYETKGPVATITLDREDARNAYSEEMIPSLIRAFDAAQADDAIRVAILTGAGTAFSAGGDLKAMRDRSGMFAGGPVELRTRYVDGIQRVPRRIRDFEKPLIAAINGAAIGAGLDLACMCDLRIASDRAKFGSTFVKVGLVPGDGGAYFLARAVGFSRALELMLTGRVIDGAEAVRVGLILETVPASELMARAHALAESIAENAPLAVRMTKRAAYRSLDTDFEGALEMAASFQGMVQQSADHLEAVNAILGKRSPNFTGR
jgi:enoyl-CoA hydratase/carnithine racemase